MPKAPKKRPSRRRRLTWSIRNRILVPNLLLIVAMVGLTGIVTSSWAASRAAGQYLDRGRDTAKVLRLSTFPLTAGILEQLRGLAGAEFALVDANGHLTASTLVGVSPGLNAMMQIAENSGVSFLTSWTHGGLTYRLAIVDRLTSSGPERLVILLPESSLKAAEWEARRGVLILTLLSAGLAALLASWIGQTLSQPLSQIHRSVRRIGRGDLRPTGLPSKRRDEIGELASGVAMMARWLRRLRKNQVRTQRLKLIRQVSAGLAHELRNPLTAARMTLQIFIERNHDRDTEALRIALDELSRMERQVRRFLQIARPEPPRFETTDLTPLLERTLAGLQGMALHQGIALDLRSEVDRPSPVCVDPDQIMQVFANLCANALEAAGPGGVVRLVLTVRDSGEVVIDVEDDGPGISPSDQGRLFQPFASTKPEGVGLGLALCKAVVREHGGTIAYDRAGAWTRFRVTLPPASKRRESPSLAPQFETSLTR